MATKTPAAPEKTPPRTPPKVTLSAKKGGRTVKAAPAASTETSAEKGAES